MIAEVINRTLVSDVKPKNSNRGKYQIGVYDINHHWNRAQYYMFGELVYDCGMLFCKKEIPHIGKRFEKISQKD